MNKKQAQAIVELIQEGFTKEAFVLAQAYSEVENNERLASSEAFVKVKQTLLKFIPLSLLKSVVTKISSKVFPGEDINLEKVLSKLKKVTLILIGIVASYIMYQLLDSYASQYVTKRLEEKRPSTPYERPPIDVKKEKAVYQSQVHDNLKALKYMINKMEARATKVAPAI